MYRLKIAPLRKFNNFRKFAKISKLWSKITREWYIVDTTYSIPFEKKFLEESEKAARRRQRYGCECSVNYRPKTIFKTDIVIFWKLGQFPENQLPE